tara:strand:+ start:500 stop:766 length:267 start_codon:yes stop_codon:yes gene_type:complete
MATTHAKLYASTSGWTTAKNKLEASLGIPRAGTSKYCERIQVRAGHSDGGKYILPIETGDNCQWKTDHLVTGEIPYDFDWIEEETPPE